MLSLFLRISFLPSFRPFLFCFCFRVSSLLGPCRILLEGEDEYLTSKVMELSEELNQAMGDLQSNYEASLAAYRDANYEEPEEGENETTSGEQEGKEGDNGKEGSSKDLPGPENVDSNSTNASPPSPKVLSFFEGTCGIQESCRVTLAEGVEAKANLLAMCSCVFLISFCAFLQPCICSFLPSFFNRYINRNGKPFNYQTNPHKSAAFKGEASATREAESESAAEAEEVDKEGGTTPAADQHEISVEVQKKVLDEAKMQEEDLLEARSKPLRCYLMERVVPLITEVLSFFFVCRLHHS